MKRCKRILSMLLVCCMVMALLPITAAAANIVASGTCGDNLTWTLDDEGTLTISGTGTMPNYYTSSSVPWYSNCDAVKTVIIENGVTGIGYDAFRGYTNLTNVTISDSVTNIESGAFWNTGLTSVAIPDSVTSIGNGAFSSCSSLTSIIVSSNNPNYTSINGILFNEDRSTLLQYPAGKEGTSYIIPDSVTSIGVSAFSGCTGLTSVTIPDSITIIGNYAFSECAGLTSVTIPDSVTSIGLCAFQNCTGLTSVTIPNSVTSIRDSMFRFCTGLTSVTIPNSVTSIGYYAFYFCTSLTDVYYAGSESDWAAISIEGHNADLTNATTHYNSTGPVSEAVFDPDIYRANRLLNTSNAETATMISILSEDTPCGMYVPLLQKSGFETWETAWTTLTTTFDAIDNPSTLYDFAVKEKDVYSAVILNMLETATDYGIVDSCNALVKDTKSLVSVLDAVFKAEYHIEISDANNWAALTDEQQVRMREVSEAFYSKDSSFAKFSKVFSNMGMALEIADDVETYVEQISSAIALVNMSESLKSVVRTMYQQCPSANIYMKMALLDCVEIIDSSTDELIAKLMTDAFSVVGIEIAQRLVDELWKEIKFTLNVGFPYLDILLAGYKTGKWVSNTLFRTDSTIEQYCVMLAVLDVEDLMASVFETLQEEYLAVGDKDTAAAYLAAIDVMFMSRDQDCVAACKFVDILDDALANQIGALFDPTGANQRTGIKNSINSIQASYDTVHSSILTSWILSLEEDYPDSGLYEEYYSLYIQSGDFAATKKYVAACPVDVYVYDSANNLVAYVIDNKPYCSGNLTVSVVGDTKEMYFYDDEEYRIEYIGNDTGTMDLTITEYDSDGAEQRNVYFYDVILNDGETYTIEETGQTLNEITYSLKEDGRTVQPDLDTDNTDNEKYTVSINSGSMIIDGELFFETEAYVNENIDICAYVPDGYEFYGWTSDLGADIFENATSRITTLRVPEADVNINAISINGSGQVYTVTFNANGGTVETSTMTTGTDGKLSSLPTSTRSGYTFNGWYTAVSGGTPVSTETVFDQDTTLYAVWKQDVGTSTTVSGQSFEISVTGTESDYIVVLSLYQEGRLVEVHMETRTGSSIQIETSQPYDTAKVMLLDPQYAPLCSAETILQ